MNILHGLVGLRIVIGEAARRTQLGLVQPGELLQDLPGRTAVKGVADDGVHGSILAAHLSAGDLTVDVCQIVGRGRCLEGGQEKPCQHQCRQQRADNPPKDGSRAGCLFHGETSVIRFVKCPGFSSEYIP